MSEQQPPSFSSGSGGGPTFTPGGAGGPSGGGNGGGNKKPIILFVILGIITAVLLIGGLLIFLAAKSTKDEADDAARQIADAYSAITSTTAPGNAPTTAPSPKLFPGRVGARPGDQERNVGQTAQLKSSRQLLSALALQQADEINYVVADVRIENRTNETQSYNYYDWRLQTSNGEVIEATQSSSFDGLLNSGDLVNGGTAQGKIVFDVGDRKGEFYVTFEPPTGESERGVWKITT